MKKFILALFLCIAIAAPAFAQTPTPVIVSPADGSTLYGSSISVQYRVDGDPDMLGVKYVYIKQDHETCTYSENLNSSYTFQNVRPGEHKFSIRMEDAMFQQVGDLIEVTVNVRDAGEGPSAKFISLRDNSTILKSDIRVRYKIEGRPIPSSFSHVSVILDGGEELRSSDLQGSVIFKGVLDGPHLVGLSMRDAANSIIGSEVQASITVATSLNETNAKKVRRWLSVLARGKANPDKLTRIASKLRKLLKKMKGAGEVNPVDPQYARKDVRKAGKLLKKLENGAAGSRLKKQIKKLFTITS